MNKEFVIVKIHLESLIESLSNVYKGGADYIDMVCSHDEQQDYVGIMVKPEYIRNDSKLSQEDINNLIV